MLRKSRGRKRQGEAVELSNLQVGESLECFSFNWQVRNDSDYL